MKIEAQFEIRDTGEVFTVPLEVGVEELVTELLNRLEITFNLSLIQWWEE